MRKNKTLILIFCFLFLLLSSLLLAEDEDKVKLSGTFDFGYRYVNVDGNQDKYFEDLNIRKGPRLLNLNIDVIPSGKYSKYFDILNIYATTIGGDPFESYGFTLKKYGNFNFRYGHRKVTYFYKDTILPPEQADVRATTGGDFHTFSFDKNFDDIYFDVKLFDRVKFFLDFDRISRQDESTTTVDVSRDEFEFDKPLEELKTDYRAGLQINLDKVDFYIEGSYRDYENEARFFLPGFSSGADAENVVYPTVLYAFEQMTPYEFTMPMANIRVNIRPTDKIKATVGYIFSDLDMELDYEEQANGIGYTGASLLYEDLGKADISRKINMLDIDLSYRALDNVYFIGGFRYNKLDQDGKLEIDGDVSDSAADIKTNIYEFGAQVIPNKALTLTGGIRHESREAKLIHDDEGEAETTDRTSFFFNANYSPSDKINLLGEYERGSFDNPYTLMSPTDLNRFKVRAKIRPTKALNLMFTYLRRDLDNDNSGGKFDSNTYSFDLAYSLKEKLYVSAGYSRQDIDTSISNVVTYLFLKKTWDILYESGNNIFRGSLKYKINKNFAAGAMAYYYKNSGSWELDWTIYKVWLKYNFDSGYKLLLSYQRNDYDEKQYNFDDYSSNIFTVGFGYKF
ncbi:MAG: hypothetical protein ACE5WD_04720 [Candidatus Aminicenantia bacterium]